MGPARGRALDASAREWNRGWPGLAGAAMPRCSPRLGHQEAVQAFSETCPALWGRRPRGELQLSGPGRASQVINLASLTSSCPLSLLLQSLSGSTFPDGGG